MKIVSYKCDRCGKTCEQIRSNHGLHIYKKVYILANVHKYDEPFDLCKDCYKSLAEWINKNKESEEDEK